MAKYNSPTRKFLNVTLPSLFILILLICLPTNHVDADMGPKPTMDFEFEYETVEPLEIVEGVLYECDQADCSDAKPLEELGPQGFSCTATSCFSMAYQYSDYHRLAIRFSDGKERESNIFKSNAFSLTYRVIVRENDLSVEKVRGRSNPMGWSLAGLFIGGLLALILGVIMLILLVLIILRAGEERANFTDSRWIFISLWFVMGILLILASFFSILIPITLLVELFFVLLYVIIKKRSILTMLTMTALANMITLPFLWMVPNFGGESYIPLFTLFAEIIIWIVESLVLYLTQRKSVRYWEMLLLSLALNGCSFILGLLLPF